MGFILVAIIFNFQLGAVFLYAMIALACGYILYDTSNVLHHYRVGQHVAAALALFASVALLFWYVVQLFMSRRRLMSDDFPDEVIAGSVPEGPPAEAPVGGGRDRADLRPFDLHRTAGHPLPVPMCGPKPAVDDAENGRPPRP